MERRGWLTAGRHITALREITPATVTGTHTMIKVLSLTPSPVTLAPASYYFRFYLARTMVHAGLGDEYVPQLKPRRAMLARGLSTWAETPEPTRSDLHAWSAHPTLDILTIADGIAPGSPGFRSVTITPRLGGLQYVDAALPTPKGLVTARYTREKSQWRAMILYRKACLARLSGMTSASACIQAPRKSSSRERALKPSHGYLASDLGEIADVRSLA